jgi:phage terminase large subunit
MKDSRIVIDPARFAKGLGTDRKRAALIVERMRQEPILFAEHVLGIRLWEKQRRIFEDVFRHRAVAVRSCHASGKSFCAAAIVLTFVNLYQPCVAVTTAPTARQVFTIIWREINRMIAKSKVPLGGKPLTGSYTLSEDAYAIGVATDDPDKLQGIHSENVLVVVDEASGYPEPMWEAVDSLLASGNARILAIGNPTRNQGYFHRIFNDPNFGAHFVKHSISAFDTPNVKQRRTVIPGLITWEWVEQRRRIWGENHPLYKIRVLGEFPGAEYSNVVIPPDLIEKAKNADLGDPQGPVILGVDVAEMGDAETVVAVRRGYYLLGLYHWTGADVADTCQRIMHIIRKHNAKEVRVDKIGVGSGVYSFLKEAIPNDVAVVGVDVREPTSYPDIYHDYRTELWYEFRKAIQDGKVSFARYKDPEEDILYGQLSAPTFSPTPHGLIKMESKLEMRKRGVPSPDRADAVVYAFAEVRTYAYTMPTMEQIESMMKEPTLVSGGLLTEEPPWRGEERTSLAEILKL